jgi:hypothetical protein
MSQERVAAIKTLDASCGMLCRSRVSPLLTPQVAEMPAMKSTMGNAIVKNRLLVGLDLIRLPPR